MKRILILTTLLSLVFLMACGVSPIRKGVIVDKQYHKAHEEDSSTMTMVGGVPMVMSDTTKYPEEWVVIVEGYDDNKEKRQVEVELSKKEYDLVEIGDDFMIR